jgi:hypothetical protein
MGNSSVNPSCRGGFLLIGLLALLAFDASPAHARWPSSDFGCLTLTPGGLFNQVGVQDACSDGSGGTYVLWYAGAPVLTACLQHLDAFGDECFLGGALALASNTQPMCVAPDGMGGVVVLSQVWPSGSSDVEVAL